MPRSSAEHYVPAFKGGLYQGNFSTGSGSERNSFREYGSLRFLKRTSFGEALGTEDEFQNEGTRFGDAVDKGSLPVPADPSLETYPVE